MLDILRSDSGPGVQTLLGPPSESDDDSTTAAAFPRPLRRLLGTATTQISPSDICKRLGHAPDESSLRLCWRFSLCEDIFFLLTRTLKPTEKTVRWCKDGANAPPDTASGGARPPGVRVAGAPGCFGSGGPAPSSTPTMVGVTIGVPAASRKFLRSSGARPTRPRCPGRWPRPSGRCFGRSPILELFSRPSKLPI